MNQKNDHQADLDGHHKGVVDERVGVFVEGVLPEKHEQVSSNVEDEIQKKKNPGGSDDQFGGDEGGQKAGTNRH